MPDEDRFGSAPRGVRRSSCSPVEWERVGPHRDDLVLGGRDPLDADVEMRPDDWARHRERPAAAPEAPPVTVPRLVEREPDASRAPRRWPWRRAASR